MKKSYIVLSIGIINTLYSLWMLIDKMSITDEQWATRFSLDRTTLVWFVSSLMVILLGYVMLKEEKNK